MDHHLGCYGTLLDDGSFRSDITEKDGNSTGRRVRIFNGMDSVDNGALNVLGQDIHKLNTDERLAFRRRMSFATQKPYMLRTTVQRNVEYPLDVRGVPSPG